MPCYYPLIGYRSKHLNDNGRREIVFDRRHAFDDAEVIVPCSQCIGCRLDRSRMWSVRCMLESQLHPENCFITLTYSDEFLPSDGGLVKHHFQDFMKRLRYYFSDRSIRYYMCGEYGFDEFQPSRLGRPHFHAILFNVDFSDKVLISKENGFELYDSAILSRIWKFGIVSVGSVTLDSAGYVARYCTKKVTGDLSDSHYFKLSYETGELYTVDPEYSACSINPAIARDWFNKYAGDTLKGFIVIDGRKIRIPKYFDLLMKESDVYYDDYERIKGERRVQSFEAYLDNTVDRLRVREGVARRRFNKLPRNLDNEY